MMQKKEKNPKKRVNESFTVQPLHENDNQSEWRDFNYLLGGTAAASEGILAPKHSLALNPDMFVIDDTVAINQLLKRNLFLQRHARLVQEQKQKGSTAADSFETNIHLAKSTILQFFFFSFSVAGLYILYKIMKQRNN